jgi:hypothetical protein
LTKARNTSIKFALTVPRDPSLIGPSKLVRANCRPPTKTTGQAREKTPRSRSHTAWTLSGLRSARAVLRFGRPQPRLGRGDHRVEAWLVAQAGEIDVLRGNRH